MCGRTNIGDSRLSGSLRDFASGPKPDLVKVLRTGGDESHQCRQIAHTIKLPMPTKRTGKNHLSKKRWSVNGTGLAGATAFDGEFFIGATGSLRECRVKCPDETDGQV
jgi:hypothetical protein